MRKPRHLVTTEPGKLPKGYRHGDIIEGFLPCTIPDKKHDGPCALPTAPSVYGYDKTIHRTTQLDVELDEHGDVVAVWFRCQMLPFRQSRATEARARQLRHHHDDLPELVAVELQDR